MNVKSRIERLKKQFPGSGIGLVILGNDGWTATRGKMQAHFPTEEEAISFLKPCKSIVIIDV